MRTLCASLAGANAPEVATACAAALLRMFSHTPTRPTGPGRSSVPPAYLRARLPAKRMQMCRRAPPCGVCARSSPSGGALCLVEARWSRSAGSRRPPRPRRRAAAAAAAPRGVPIITACSFVGVSVARACCFTRARAARAPPLGGLCARKGAGGGAQPAPCGEASAAALRRSSVRVHCRLHLRGGRRRGAAAPPARARGGTLARYRPIEGTGSDGRVRGRPSARTRGAAAAEEGRARVPPSKGGGRARRCASPSGACARSPARARGRLSRAASRGWPVQVSLSTPVAVAPAADILLYGHRLASAAFWSTGGALLQGRNP